MTQLEMVIVVGGTMEIMEVVQGWHQTAGSVMGGRIKRKRQRTVTDGGGGAGR